MNIKHLLIAALLVPAPVMAQEAVETNPVIENIMARRSVRKYQDRQVEHAKLMLVAECGINAPSGMNDQPWAVRIVESPEFIRQTTDLFVKEHPDMAKRDPNFKNMYRNAPNIICVAGPADGSSNLDAGLLGENMMLAAQSLGLGTCCLGGPVRFLVTADEAKPYLQKLNIPEDYELIYILAIGYPDETPTAKPRDASKIEVVK